MASSFVQILVFATFLCSCLGEDFKLMPLPFAEDALEPFISKETVSIHYGKHHAGYVKKLNKEAQDDPPLKEVDIIQIIEDAKDFSEKVVDLASQIFNHEFYWECIKPMDRTKEKDDNKPVQGISDKFLEEIKRNFNTFSEFKKQFTDRAKTHFGSGWVWLVAVNGRLEVADGHDAQNPLSYGEIPLLTIDVWEHAYYIDYRNNRKTYVDMYFENINWEFVSVQFEALFEEDKAEL